MADALGIDRDRLLLDPPVATCPAQFDALLERRAAGEPVAYITGRRAFWTSSSRSGPGVLIPRPDSETLIASAVEHFDGTAGPRRILDLGTGSGHAAARRARPVAARHRPRHRPLATPRSTVAAANAGRLGIADRAEFRLGDWADGIAERFDLILCNPPYVATGAELGPGVAEHEPHEALFAGADGLDAIRVLAPQLPRLLAPGGLAAVEIGFDQAGSAAGLAGAATDCPPASPAISPAGRARSC